MKKKCLYIFLCFFSTLHSSAGSSDDRVVAKPDGPKENPYMIQNLSIYPDHTDPIFYLYRWIKMNDGKWFGFLKPENDTNLQKESSFHKKS